MKDLLPDLWNIVCEFAYNASLNETQSALTQILWLKSEKINSLLLNPVVYDYAEVAQTFYYNRETRTARYYAKYKIDPPTTTPLQIFFVWFELDDLFNTRVLERLLWDLDYRSVKKHMVDCPITIVRFARENLTQWIRDDPVSSSIYLNTVLPKLRLDMLRYYPSTISMIALYPVDPPFE
jgi:hypothetical protein